MDRERHTSKAKLRWSEFDRHSGRKLSDTGTRLLLEMVLKRNATDVKTSNLVKSPITEDATAGASLKQEVDVVGCRRSKQQGTWSNRAAYVIYR